ncbi:hypothetical protein [Neobacillus niacini]|uniref:hypothetical protein n=1 Tax=Neobacillus niacini TaxID=86668 RepID=UPI0021CB1FB7|nr:hypothetical protein [Neobacillus niacini]MCM3768760.1 hypothetical protein [Neobacillus niacini]
MFVKVYQYHIRKDKVNDFFAIQEKVAMAYGNYLDFHTIYLNSNEDETKWYEITRYRDEAEYKRSLAAINEQEEIQELFATFQSLLVSEKREITDEDFSVGKVIQTTGFSEWNNVKIVPPQRIPDELLGKIIEKLGVLLPYHCRGIKITDKLIKAAVESLNDAPSKMLPQNCRNDARDKTPDGLDLEIKKRMDFDLRTANIISDVLAEAGIVRVTNAINPQTGRKVKATKLLAEWTW